jgi:hypothetical protein
MLDVIRKPFPKLSRNSVLDFEIYFVDEHNFSISIAIDSGAVVGENRLRTSPAGEIKNLVKFHLMASVPRIPFSAFFRSLNNG